MWIISPVGLFNTQRLGRIYKDGDTTFSVLGERTVLISCDNAAYEKIIEAIKNNDNFVEVD